MDISHLYHDAIYGDPTLELDVKEQLKTRIVNAREERHLEMLSKSYERAKFICEKNTAWERWKVGQSLHGIYERSPQLDRSLAREKARVEALQHSILMKNFHTRHKQLTHETVPVSPIMRSVSSTTLNPIHANELQSRKRRRQRRKDKKSKEETDGLTQSITERHQQRPGDFVRRTEHVVKSLAKLNWRKQNRRRDHERFKEELKLHSKPVMDRARVILKGRSDIDVESMVTDFENILVSQQKNENNPNDINDVKTSRSTDASSLLTTSNVLQLPDISDVVSRLQSVSETSSSLPIDFKTDGRESNPSSDVIVDSTSSKRSLSPSASSERANEKLDSMVKTKDKPSGKHDQVPGRPHQLQSYSQNNNNNYQRDSRRSNGKSPSPQSPRSEKGVVSPTRSRARCLHVGHDGRKSNVGEVLFSPSTSVSQVILEEEEEDEEKKGGGGEGGGGGGGGGGGVEKSETNKTKDEEPKRGTSQTDSNNNHVDSIPTSPTRRTRGPNDGYTMSNTTGLPQLWKLSLKKKKEKAAPEVSAATLARKHRKKRNESERMW